MSARRCAASDYSGAGGEEKRWSSSRGKTPELRHLMLLCVLPLLLLNRLHLVFDTELEFLQSYFFYFFFFGEIPLLEEYFEALTKL